MRVMIHTAYGYCRASTGKQDLTFEVQRASMTCPPV
jgi:hypothetical protein